MAETRDVSPTTILATWSTEDSIDSSKSAAMSREQIEIHTNEFRTTKKFTEHSKEFYS